MLPTAKISGFRKQKAALGAVPTEAAVAAGKEGDSPRHGLYDPPSAPLKPSESAEGHGPNYLSVSWAMPDGEGDGCQFEVQYGFRVGTWRNVPPAAATVEDDGWGAKRWTMRLADNIWPSMQYFVRVRGRNAHGAGEWSPQSFVMECAGGKSAEEAAAEGLEVDSDVSAFLSDLNSVAGGGGSAAAAGGGGGVEEGEPPERETVTTAAAESSEAGLLGALETKLNSAAAAVGAAAFEAAEEPAAMVEMRAELERVTAANETLEAEVERWKTKAASYAADAEEVPESVQVWRQEKLAELKSEAKRWQEEAEAQGTVFD